MTEIKCPNCGSENINKGTYFIETLDPAHCNSCEHSWEEDYWRPPNTVPTGDKAECINLAEQARYLIDFLLEDDWMNPSEHELLRDAVDTMENYIYHTQPPNAWIACSERLPNEDVEVLAYSIDGEVYPDCINYIEDGIPFWNWFGHSVTHWQPLPEPPVRKGGE